VLERWAPPSSSAVSSAALFNNWLRSSPRDGPYVG
jgi:hypothetical protein